MVFLLINPALVKFAFFWHLYMVHKYLTPFLSNSRLAQFEVEDLDRFFETVCSNSWSMSFFGTEFANFEAEDLFLVINFFEIIRFAQIFGLRRVMVLSC